MSDDKVYDIIEDDDSEAALASRFADYQVRAVIWPSRWKSASIAKTPKWIEVKFESKTASCVPTTPGIYAFCIAVDCDIAPRNTVVAYIGKAEASLRSRFQNYLNLKRRRLGQVLIRRLLRHWGDDLSFMYWSINDNKCDLHGIEEKLNDAIIPPFVKKDYSASVRSEVQLFRER